MALNQYVDKKLNNLLSRALNSFTFAAGEVAEWSIATVLKTVVL
jgi:hypothetical protein